MGNLMKTIEPATKSKGCSGRIQDIEIQLPVVRQETLRFECCRVWVDVLIMQHTPVYLQEETIN